MGCAMKLIKRSLDRDASGTITMATEEPEDVWHLYNIMQHGDRITSSSRRRIQHETGTGSVVSDRVQVKLTVGVEKIDFDTAQCELHVAGKVMAENPYVRLGAYHTLSITPGTTFSLYKAEWDSYALGLVDDACNAAARAEIGAVVLQEGLANVCLLTEHMTLLQQRIEYNVPRKQRGSTTAHDKGLAKFYETILQCILAKFDFSRLKVVLLASPGFSNRELLQHMMDHANKADSLAWLLRERPKFVLAHCSTGHIHSLNEALKTPEVQASLADTKYAREVRALDDFYKMMTNDEQRAWYGPSHVLKAADEQAISTLLLTDTLFRSQDIATRRKYINLADRVRANGGTVYIFSSLHESGKQLDQLSGIAAILSFPLPDLEDEEEGE